MDLHLSTSPLPPSEKDSDEDDFHAKYSSWDNSEDAGRVTPQDPSQDVLPRDQQRKTAFYDYASEKSFSHADSKLFYQRHQLELQGLQDGQQLNRSNTAPSSEADGESLSRKVSKSSRVGLNGPTSPSYSSFSPSTRINKFEPSDAPLSETKLLGARVKATPQGQGQIASTGASGQSETSQPDNPEAFNSPEQGNGGSTLGPTLPSTTGIATGNETGVSPELSEIYTNIQKILDIRHKYIRLSLQGSGDNPKDDPNWPIYPPPPEPVWEEENNRPVASSPGPKGAANIKNLATDETFRDSKSQSLGSNGVPVAQASTSMASRRPRKPGQDIGEDFQMSDVLPLPDVSEMIFKLDGNSVFQVYETAQSAEHDTPILSIPTIRDFYMDLDAILSISSDGPSKSFAFRRLQYLEGKYNLYFLLNEYEEMADSKRVPHRDFYNVRKVDTHVHHSSCMNQKHLLRFIKSKMKKCPDEVVLFRDGKHLTLAEVFESINLTAYDLSIDTLDMHAHTDSFHRFDKFNLKYNPIGESRLRTIFLKTDNLIDGRYLAELTKEVIADLESSKYQMVEWRISIYGRDINEWDKLAAWVVKNKLFSHNVRWLIQVPRLFDIYKASEMMENFEQVVINVFLPLFEVTKDPASHPELSVFLERVVGFDSVDDESKPERRLFRKFPLPKVWDTKQNPPYSYWIYYLFANITSLNAWRKQRGMNTFLLRPHCGEAGETDHLAAAVLCCHSISHGILLRKVPLLQYIFYLEQIGIAMSPLSNNALFLAYERNPFLQYFRRGLNVSLSTDDPLQIAFTKEPLIEEYSVAAQIYKLNAVDMCELAKNSVVQSGFEHTLKQRWLGNDYNLPGEAGNNVAKTNVPNIRAAFRRKTLLEELSMIERYTSETNSAQPVSSANLPPPRRNASSLQGPPSPSASMRTNASTTNPDGQENRKRQSIPIRDGRIAEFRKQPSHGSYMTRVSPTASSGFDVLTDIAVTGDVVGTEPRLFPGLVHERTRRGSLRRGSNAGKDNEGLSTSYQSTPRSVVGGDKL